MEQTSFMYGINENDDTEETVTITKNEYDSLKSNVDWVEALNAAGVDNWEGYAFAEDIFVSFKPSLV